MRHKRGGGKVVKWWLQKKHANHRSFHSRMTSQWLAGAVALAAVLLCTLEGAQAVFVRPSSARLRFDAVQQAVVLPDGSQAAWGSWTVCRHIMAERAS
jgi:hypothetical protein